MEHTSFSFSLDKMSPHLRYVCLCNFLSATALIAGCTSLLVLVFPIAEITVGVMYLHECPAAPLIPVYLMVCGIVAVLLMGLALHKLFCPAAPHSRIWTVCLLSLVLFAFVWILYGSYLIYSMYPPNYTKSSNSSIFAPSAADNEPDSSSDQNLNQSRPNLTLTGMTNNNNNQTLMQLIQSLSVSRNSSTQTNREHVNAAQRLHVEAAALHCDRMLYLFAFWTTTLVLVASGNTLLIVTWIYGNRK
ncbi:uncharacterized protein LOC132990365 [Labrus mixtus]|uniref:uncharacterized protein LOC132990365 n=1 Tax=Labrus mixtus TaxID=508554 RepID=UPI0029C0E3C1|nr:uncharacterized protein LOC132990365 [Labrus mixtus]